MYYNEISYLPIEDFNKKESTFDFLGFTSSSNVEINNLRNEYKGFNLYMKWHTYLNAEGPLDAPDTHAYTSNEFSTAMAKHNGSHSYALVEKSTAQAFGPGTIAHAVALGSIANSVGGGIAIPYPVESVILKKKK